MVDHVFVCCADGAPEADAQAALGLVEGSPNAHPGQGTACRRFFFANAYPPDGAGVRRDAPRPGRPEALLALVALTLASGIGDAQGFVHAARMWQDGRLVWRELLRSALGFGVGIGSYWVAVRDLTRAGVVGAEVQTLVWFGVTIVGVAVVSRRFLGWPLADQAVAAGVLLGLGWLVWRSS